MPCLRRAASVEEEYEAAGGEILIDNEDNDGWLATHGKPKGMYVNWNSLSLNFEGSVLQQYLMGSFFSRNRWQSGRLAFHGNAGNQQEQDYSVNSLIFWGWRGRRYTWYARVWRIWQPGWHRWGTLQIVQFAIMHNDSVTDMFPAFWLMQATLQTTYLMAHEPDDDNILRTRTYDISIT